MTPTELNGNNHFPLDSKDFLLKEYDRLCSEVIWINESTKTFAKLFSTFLVGYFATFIFGYSTIIKESTTGIYFIYTLVAFLYAILIIIVGVFYVRQYSISRKHKTRYRISIDRIRTHFLTENFPEGYLMTSQLDKGRPQISGGEYNIPFIFAALTVVPLYTIPFLMVSMINARIKDVHRAGHFTFWVMFPFMLTVLYYYVLNSLYFARNITESESMSLSKKEKFPSMNLDKEIIDIFKPKYSWIILVVFLLLSWILAVLIYFRPLWTDKLEGNFHIKYAYWVIVFFSILFVFHSALIKIQRFSDARCVYLKKITSRLKTNYTASLIIMFLQLIIFMGLFIVLWSKMCP